MNDHLAFQNTRHLLGIKIEKKKEILDKNLNVLSNDHSTGYVN